MDTAECKYAANLVADGDLSRPCAPGRLSSPLIASAAAAAGPVSVPGDRLADSFYLGRRSPFLLRLVRAVQLEDVHAEEFTSVQNNAERKKSLSLPKHCSMLTVLCSFMNEDVTQTNQKQFMDTSDKM